MRFLCILLPFLLSVCGNIEAKGNNTISLTTFQQGDSTRVIATWNRPCDSRGCADNYKVTWSNKSSSKTTKFLSDTTYYATPIIGDSLLVSISITSIRRSLESPPKSAQIYIYNADKNPPPIDSIKVDTLSQYDALLDSFPSFIIRGNTSIKKDSSSFLCALAKNRYNGSVRIITDPSLTVEEENEALNACEKARASYEAERSG